MSTTRHTMTANELAALRASFNLRYERDHSRAAMKATMESLVAEYGVSADTIYNHTRDLRTHRKIRSGATLQPKPAIAPPQRLPLWRVTTTVTALVEARTLRDALAVDVANGLVEDQRTTKVELVP